jgi:hypothetical protein
MHRVPIPVGATHFLAMRTAMVIGAVVFGGATGEVLVAPRAENHPIRVGIVLGVLLLVVGLVRLVSEGRHTVVALVFLGGLGFGWFVGWDNRDNYIDPYCRYGAKSQAELDSCLSHVNSDDIDELQTNAAQFARGTIDECRDDAGPYCAAEAKSR